MTTATLASPTFATAFEEAALGGFKLLSERAAEMSQALDSALNAVSADPEQRAQLAEYLETQAPKIIDQVFPGAANRNHNFHLELSNRIESIQQNLDQLAGPP